MTHPLSKTSKRNFELIAAHAEEFHRKFGEQGLNISERRRSERSKSDKEIYLLRRYLFTLHNENILRFPLQIAQSETPDFVCQIDGVERGLEITEATSSLDQREFTKMEDKEEPQLLGTFGGRFKGGASGDEPERALTADVIRAIRRKKFKRFRTASTDLLIYGNSNAVNLIFNEKRAIDMMHKSLQRWDCLFKQGSGLGQVSLILGSKLAFDIGGTMRLFDVCAEINS